MLGVEVQQYTREMLNTLLQQLRANVQLPTCLRVIGFIRRLGVFSEQELRIQFLYVRDAWLIKVLDSSSCSSSLHVLC